MKEDKLDMNDFDNLGFDKEDYIYDNEREIDISNNRLENRAFALSNMVWEFEDRLKGFNTKNHGEKMVYQGNPLAGHKTIQRIMLLLDPFSKSVNMISNKNNFTWQVQRLRTRVALASILATANDSNLENFKEIWRTFSNLLVNIGDVILNKNSRSMLRDFFGIGEENQIERLTKNKEGDIIV